MKELIDFKFGDIIRYTGKTINSVTKGSDYAIIKEYKFEPYIYSDDKISTVVFLDNNKREKKILMNNNQWRAKFIYVSNIRKEKLKKLNETN